MMQELLQVMYVPTEMLITFQVFSKFYVFNYD